MTEYDFIILMKESPHVNWIRTGLNHSEGCHSEVERNLCYIIWKYHDNFKNSIDHNFAMHLDL